VILAILAFFSAMPQRGNEASVAPPVLTVCDALRNLSGLNGKYVILVGRSFVTFEGGFMNENCESDGQATVEGERWLSMIALGRALDRPGNAVEIEWPTSALEKKLAQVQRTTQVRPNSSMERWTAVYGQLEIPRPLRQKPLPGQRSYTGNGYGANGTVPARIHVVRTYDWPPPPALPRGR
jgi:hypothetical protein